MKEAGRFPVWDDNFDIGAVLNADVTTLLTTYSRIPATEIERHVRAVAHKGWEIHEYPCFREFWFLDLDLSRSPAYQRIVDRIKDGALFIDLGCGLGQDIRKLVFNGAPPGNLIGLDLHSGLVDLGYELFRDAGSLEATFLAQDFFEDTPGLVERMGKIGVINSGFFMHLWDWDGQVKIGQRMVQLLSDEGGLVTGLHLGSSRGGIWKLPSGEDVFQHSPTTLRDMWAEIGKLTGTVWRVTTTVEMDEKCKHYDPDGLKLGWVAELERPAI